MSPAPATNHLRGRPPAGRWSALAFAAAVLCALPLLAQYDPALQYQNRGNRHEGLRPKPVSGYDIELLSALVDGRAPGPGWPPALRLKFYLPANDKVFVIVRQPRPRTDYYWLDKVVPPAPWRARSFNEFSWPTEPVLRKLSSFSAGDLGVVVRLRREDPSRAEMVAPAALFAAQPPPAATGYRFTFKTNGTARVSGRISRSDKEVFRRPQSWERAGSPFTLVWDAQGQPDGEYRLDLSGYFDDNTPLVKEVRFHHRAAWR